MKLTTARDIYKNQLEYIEQKQVLQRKLVERYQKCYVKTWISPLKCQEDEITIHQVYVTPDLVVEEKSVPETESKPLSCKTVTQSKYANRNLKHISQYRDIFQTNCMRCKKIYIVGDVGTGKSSFSKMMIHNWCKSVKEDNCDTRAQIPTVDSHNSQNESNEEYSTIDSKDNAEDERDIKEMEMFDFLFFVPLQRMSEFSSDILEMIRELYKDIVSDELIKRIFCEESDHCCIIADGLDEWTIPKQFPHPRHITYGIPNGDRVQNATIVTLSRPSAKGILNLKSSECDRKIVLRGVSKESLGRFTRKYMSIQTRIGYIPLSEEEEEEESSASDFLEKLLETKFHNLEKTPMLLQQLVWLYCRRKDIGTSISDIYSNIVNIMFGWSKNKEDEDCTDDSANVPIELEGMELPELLKNFPRCETNQRFIFILSKLSFEALTDSTSSYTLGRSKLQKCGLSQADIASLIKFGIIEEYNSLDPTFEQTYFSFIHLSYLEFFAAVYVSIRYHALHSSSQAKKRKKERTPLEDIFLKLHSTAHILEMSNLFIMLCGLSPFLVEELFCLISKTVRTDERLISNRENLFESDIEEPELIQKLLQDCCLECSDFNTAICLSDIFITSSNSYLIRQINPKEVLSLCIEHYFLWDDYTVNWITQLPHLQLACIEIDNVECGKFDKLLEALKQVVSLKQLFLYNRYNSTNIQRLSRDFLFRI
ncbi:uncharacterized protein LOC123551999 isoform X1 [Mercenaria mercenaria]|uniref:uncharacterized protein LOC123551999 isoform X1 n=1 Tax=Mercenaria mercenaria TaxID=6596 RepID=UPI00234F7D29|nr:uncharacterized protein LOC123551999 isoform X1 [Mercenaria mercenaria]